MQDWSGAQLAQWLRDTLGLANVAAEAEANDIDGATAAEFGKEEWVDLGVRPPLHSSLTLRPCSSTSLVCGALPSREYKQCMRCWTSDWRSA